MCGKYGLYKIKAKPEKSKGKESKERKTQEDGEK